MTKVTPVEHFGEFGKFSLTGTALRAMFVAVLGVSTTVSAQTTNPYAKPSPAPTSATQANHIPMDNLTSFATGGTRILESIKGDLTGKGRADVVLVLDPPLSGKEKLGEGANREVALLTRDDAGQLHRAASNARIVPCAQCGGVAGDPYAYTRIGKAEFTIVVGGGSRERWTDEYTFTYVDVKKDWFVSTVVRKVVDTDGDKEKHVTLTGKDLGETSFSAFDPSHLPEVTLP